MSLRSIGAALTLSCLFVPGWALADPPPPFDPRRGIDRDGRIPAIDKPAALEHPERWRYIPEGRIKPGNVIQRFLVSSFIAPLVFRNGDVGTGGGIALTDIDFRTQRRREFAGMFLSYTSEGQQNYSMLWRRWTHHIDLAEGGVLQEERSFISAFAGYSRTLTRRFFGFGPSSRESGETSYTDENFLAELGVHRSFPDPGDPVVLGIGIRGELHELSRGRVSGSPSTEAAFPEVFRRAQHNDLLWMIFSAAWDTRDSPVNPYSGWFARGTAEVAPLQSRGHVGARYTLDSGVVLPLPPLFHDGGDPGEENPPTDTLAFGLLTQTVSGDLPFFALPALGGALTHRGFIEGRFRDRGSWLFASEYRFWVLPRGIPVLGSVRIERIGAALFYEAGTVDDDWLALFGARVHHSFGVGFRATLERSAPFRLDVGFSGEGVSVSARFGLSF